MPTKPEAPVRGYSFTDFQALNPEDPLPGTNVDIEFDRGYQTDADFLAWLSVSVADDGTIRREALGDITGDQGPTGPQGIRGPAGIDGQQGPQGIPGPQGAQGPIGPSGQSYEPNAKGLAAARSTYDSQPPGFGYLATDTGQLSFRTTAAAGTWSSWFVFTKGDPGPQGAQGPQGIQGPEGDPGADGLDGLNGAQGVPGTPGATGTPGSTGWTPLMAAETYNDKRLIKVTDYINGTGPKPTATGYLTTTGLTGNKDLAVDFRQAALTVYTTQMFGPATAGTTTFTIDGGYLVGTLRVFKNGLRQRPDIDYAASNGVTVVFTNPFAGGEYVLVEEMAPFEIASTYSKPLNLSDVPDKAAARLNLGIPGAAGGGSTSVAGLIRLATDAEARAKASSSIALTPANMANFQATADFAGITRYSKYEWGEMGDSNNTYTAMTPNGVHYAINTRCASWVDRTLYVSGAGPSGGKDGDIWMQII